MVLHGGGNKIICDMDDNTQWGGPLFVNIAGIIDSLIVEGTLSTGATFTGGI